MSELTTETKPIAAIQDTIIEDFEIFDDWMDRYKYIIELGQALPDLPEEYKTEENKVRGCQSQVWVHAEPRDGKIVFAADSDAMIVRGLIALIVQVYSGHTPSEILNAEPYFIEKIGMSEHLSMSRSNGLQAMVKQIKLYALGYQSIEAQG